MGPQVLERIATPRGELQLQKRGEHFEVISNGIFLMATYNGESERLLVTAALNAAASPRRVLVGGLGVGFSLAAAVSDPRVEQATVVEIEEPLIGWNRTYLAPASGHALGNPKTRVINRDLVEWVRETTEPFDVVCLDIDNGPDWTVTDVNQGLYSHEGLMAVQRLLAPGGVAAYWSAHRAPAFGEHLQTIYAEVHELAVEQVRGQPDYIYLAKGPR